MASLESIMNTDEEGTGSRQNKKDKAPGISGERPPQQTGETHSSGSGQQAGISSSAHRRGQSTSYRLKQPAAAAAAAGSSSSTANQPISDRRRSSSTSDSMEQSNQLHGQPGASSSGTMNPSSTPMRPFSATPPGGDGQLQVKFTPVTGRISRAKKGLAVHNCQLCHKTFTRAEHLRRHQLSHQRPEFRCTVPGCHREFHRKDLLDRHQLRHEQEGDSSSKGGGFSPGRDSSARDEPSRPIQDMRAGVSESPGPGQTHSSAAVSTDMPMTPDRRQRNPSLISSPGSSNRASSFDETGGQYTQREYDNHYTLSPPEIHRPIPIIQRLPISPDDTVPPTEADLCPRTPGLWVHTDMDFPNFHILETGTPDLISAGNSAMASSASSPYSPASEHSRPSIGNNGLWPQHLVGSNDLLSPYPSQSPAPLDSTIPTSGPFTYNAGFTSNLGVQHGGLFDPSLSVQWGDDGAVSDLHQPNIHPSLVRSPTPPHTASQSETLVSQATPVSAGDLMNSLSCLARRKEGPLAFPLVPPLVPGSLPLSPRVRRSIPDFLDIYWDKVHPLYPIVRRKTSEEYGEILQCAMAAIATQYSGDKEDRIAGTQLHEYAWQLSRYPAQWDVSVMQAIFLCELFARFRGRKAAVRPSARFETLYQRVLESAVIFSSLPITGDTETQWQAWLDMESRRRLLAACFVLEAHTSMYHEQPSIHRFDFGAEELPGIPLSGATACMWAATNAHDWAVVREQMDHLGSSQPAFLSEIDTSILTPSDIESFPQFDRSIILAAESFRLSRRQNPAYLNFSNAPELASDPAVLRIANLFPNCPIANTYIALHFTPLHDLLAVSGDSWVFSQKVLHQTSFREQQDRLKPWANSAMAATATVFAARALVAFLDGMDGADGNDPAIDQTDRKKRVWKDDISDYWALYVCALIIWAFGHHVSRKCGPPRGDETAGLEWVRAVTRLSEPMNSLGNRRRDSGLVVMLVRKCLADDCLGGRSRLFVDSVCILAKLEEGVTWKWF